jgi:hypothetical protein
MASEFETMLKAQIADVEDRRAKINSELARLDGHLSGLRQALALYLGERAAPVSRLYGPPAIRESRAPDPAKSEAWAFVLRLLEGAPAQGFHVDEIDKMSADAGYSVARNTMRANLSNAARDGAIERVRVGYYRRRKPTIDNGGPGTDSAQAPEGDPSDDGLPEDTRNWTPSVSR